MDVKLPNKETEINIKELFSNKGIDCDNAFNFQIPYIAKLGGFEYDLSIFKLPLIESKNDNSIYIGIQNNDIIKEILCIKKGNNLNPYLLLPYFKVDKSNLEEGKYVNKHTQMSYNLGLFEMQATLQKEDNDFIRQLESLQIIETISIKNDLSFNEFFNNFDKFWFGEIDFNYSLTGLFDDRAYNLQLPLTETIYYFDLSHLENPKIGNSKLEKKYFEDLKECCLTFDKGRWVLQIRLKNGEYLIKDNCNGKYEKMNPFKQNQHYPKFIIYNKKTNPYFHHKKNYDLKVNKYGEIGFNEVEDFKHLSFSKSKNRWIRFQFTPFNNLNLVYYHNDKDGYYLYEYCLLAKKKDTYIATKLNPKTINSKYSIVSGYKNKYHCYLYYLDDENRVPYIQVWEDNKTKQAYGCILNMMGKWGVFDKEIIEEK